MNPLLDGTKRIVVGHRGNRAHAPENTIESFAQAVNAGADAIEFDVHLSADGIPVVHHDKTLARTTDGHGEISRMTFAELRRVDAGAQFTNDGGKTFPYRGKGHTIPRFEEVVEAFPNTPLLIEIKAPIAATLVKQIIQSHKSEHRVLIDSFHSEALKLFRGTEIAAGASRDGTARLMWEVVSGKKVTPFDFQALCIPLTYRGLPLPVKRFAKVAPRFNCRVHVWTINSPEVAKDLWASGVNGIISDDPALMLKARASFPSATLLSG
jgi:glycerophosphoryl diester phosphodiesterase